jgi:hypothetical protein
MRSWLQGEKPTTKKCRKHTDAQNVCVTRETQLYIIHLQVGALQPRLHVHQQRNDIARILHLPIFFIHPTDLSSQRNAAIERMPPNFGKFENKDERDEARE